MTPPDYNDPTVNDWIVVNRIIDEALYKMLEFFDEMGIDNHKVPSDKYLQLRLEKQRARFAIRRKG